eukprot:13489415-Alexandrium_andersonii.AAC.1
MSASLVGSEMCIRDRPARNSIGTLSKPCRNPAEPLRNALGTPSACPEPVSYTHLTLPTICSV